MLPGNNSLKALVGWTVTRVMGETLLRSSRHTRAAVLESTITLAGTLKIDRKRKLAVSTFYGELTDHDLLAHRTTIRENPAFDATFSELVDFSKISSFRVSEAALAEMANSKSIFHDASLHVVVAPENVAFNLASHYRELTRATRPNLFVVRSLEEAYALLDTARMK